MADSYSNGTSNGTSNATKAQLNIPDSATSISVKIIDVSTISNVPADALFTPPVPGVKTMSDCPSFCFLLEHPSGQKVIYDLGIRKDWETGLAPAIVERFKLAGHKPSVEKNVSEVMDESGLGKHNIKAVIWSHSHWDHTGDMSTFGPETDLVVGPGFKDYFLNGDGNSALGGVQSSDIKGRNLHEITFEGPAAGKIGRFPSHDYFGDGSLYLLDSPGHCIAHLCALVRTTTKPDTFVFLGGDAAHHCAEMRPSKFLLLPESITFEPATGQEQQAPICPGSWFEELQVSRNRDPKGPLWQPAMGHNMEEVLTTIGHMQECDGDESVLVILAHDMGFRSPNVPLFPNAINDWKERGLGQKMKWLWVKEIMAAIKQ